MMKLSGIVLAVILLGLFDADAKGKNDNLCELFQDSVICGVLSDSESMDRYYKAGLANDGDDCRIAAAMKRARNGEPITVGVIGGSITYGAHATVESRRWANLVAEWWEKRFPQSKVTLINAGIGATNSIYGVHRAERDLLKYKPDFVVVEFCVNDRGVDYNDESYEGLIRKIFNSAQKPGIIALSLLTREGSNAQPQHLPVCRNYHVTMISQRDALCGEIYDKGVDDTSFFDEGSTWGLYSHDDVHPDDWGHAVAAAMVIRRLEQIYDRMDKYRMADYVLPAPLTQNGFERSTVIDNGNIVPEQTGGWKKSGTGWIADSTSEPLAFRIKAGYIWVNFKRTNKPVGGECIVRLNGKEIARLSADFIGGWGDYIEAKMLLKEKKAQDNLLEFIYLPEKGKEFFIESLLVANY